MRHAQEAITALAEQAAQQIAGVVVILDQHRLLLAEGALCPARICSPDTLKGGGDPLIAFPSRFKQPPLRHPTLAGWSRLRCRRE